MASGGKSSHSILGKPPIAPSPLPLPRPSAPSSSNRSWVNVVSARNSQSSEFSLPLQKDQFERLKESVHDFVQIDQEFLANIQGRMQGSAYAKFLGRALSLEQIKPALLSVWNSYGSFSIADLPNGYYFIRFESADMLDSILYDGPWTIGGMVLQLSPWKPYFQPPFEKLSSAAVWIQIHNLPMEFWHVDMIESIAAQLGRLLKIDDNPLNTSRAKFARVCLEIDLSLPLKQGLWVGPGSREALVTFQYERLPVFCFHCGLIGHGTGSCTSVASSPLQSEAQLPDSVQAKSVSAEQSMPMDVVGSEALAVLDPSPIPPANLDLPPVQEDLFGPWMVVQRRRGRGAGKVQHSSSSSLPVPPSDDTWLPDAPHARHVEVTKFKYNSRGRGGRRGGSLHHGSGGRGGRGGSGFSDFFSDPLCAPDRCDPSADPQWLDPEASSEPIPPFPIPLFNSDGTLGPVASSKDLAGSLSRPVPSDQQCLPKKGPSPSPILAPSPSSRLSFPPPLVPSSVSPIPTSPPLLLSSLGPVSPQPPSFPLPDKADHLALVSKVISALCPPPGSPRSPDGDVSVRLEEDISSESSADADMDMALDQHQKTLKLEAPSRKDLSKAGSSRKKGRKILPY